MDKLFYFLERIYRFASIPVRCVHQCNNVTVFNRGYETSQDPYTCDPCILDILAQKLAKGITPILEFEDEIFLYGAVKDSFGYQIILGPVVLDEAEQTKIDEYAHRHSMERDRVFIMQSNLVHFTSVIAMINFMRNGETLTETDIASNYSEMLEEIPVNAAFQKYLMDYADNDVIRLSYEDEKAFLKRIREGNLESLNSSEFDIAVYDNRIGQLALSKSKHIEYTVCTTIALASRAAIEGGMDALSSYALSDFYLQRLEKTKSITDMLMLSHEAQLDFTRRVQQIMVMRNRTSYVEKTKSYIANHLNESFTLEDVAGAVGVTKSYLSRRFAQDEGIGVMDYTRNMRIEAAANMLRYSGESISTIASYFCFPSQSYFGAVFKKIMGVTPKRYRDRQIIIDIGYPSQARSS